MLLQKPRTLPFRLSPTVAHTPLFSTRARGTGQPPILPPTPAVEPSDSDDREPLSPAAAGLFRRRPAAPAALAPLALQSPDSAMDLDMADASPSPPATGPAYSPAVSPRHPRHAHAFPCTVIDTPTDDEMTLSSPSHAPYPSLRTAATRAAAAAQQAQPRLPTPIYGHFGSAFAHVAREARAAAAAAATGSSTTGTGPGTGATLATPPSCAPLDSPVPTRARARGAFADAHAAFLRRRRLPSPISEDEAMDGEPRGRARGRSDDGDADESRGDAEGGEHGGSDGGNGGGKRRPQHLRAERGPVVVPSAELTPETPAGLDSPGGWGRRRSDAVSEGDAGGGGGGGECGKVVFSMGFRADCDKCRERVPGHYSHVLRV